MGRILCPFCGSPWNRNMLDIYNSSHGCESGCEYMRFVVRCEKCDRIVYIKGEFGHIENEEDKKKELNNITFQDLKEAADRKDEI